MRKIRVVEIVEQILDVDEVVDKYTLTEYQASQLREGSSIELNDHLYMGDENIHTLSTLISWGLFL